MQLKEFLAIWTYYFSRPRAWSDEAIRNGESPLALCKWVTGDWLTPQLLHGALKHFASKSQGKNDYPTLFALHNRLSQDNGGTGVDERCHRCGNSGWVGYLPSLDIDGKTLAYDETRDRHLAVTNRHARLFGNYVPCVCLAGIWAAKSDWPGLPVRHRWMGMLLDYKAMEAMVERFDRAAGRVV